MSKYAWVITRDYIESDQRVGLVGPRGATLAGEDIATHPDAERFRLKDADGEVYGEGFFVDLDGRASGFEPLDDWGRGGWGCTDIEYHTGGGWKPL